MNKNAERENLAEEIAVMPKALELAKAPGEGATVILARLVEGLSLEKWDQACKSLPLSRWHAFPVDGAGAGEGHKGDLPVSPFREAHGALTSKMFEKLLGRELKRLERNGGCLSLLAIGIPDRDRIAAALGEGA